MSDEDLRIAADRVLARLVGDPSGSARLREEQWRAIEALVSHRRRALVAQRTGWGKSAVYFVATSLLRERGSGPTVIVSPLLALMRNQVEAAARAGIRARTINSANTEEWDTVQAEVAAGEVDVLLVSPEGLTFPTSHSAHISVGHAAGRSTQSAVGIHDPGRLRASSPPSGTTTSVLADQERDHRYAASRRRTSWCRTCRRSRASSDHATRTPDGRLPVRHPLSIH